MITQERLAELELRIDSLTKDRKTLLNYLKSATAWIRRSGGDCETLDEVIRQYTPQPQDYTGLWTLKIDSVPYFDSYPSREAAIRAGEMLRRVGKRDYVRTTAT